MPLARELSDLRHCGRSTRLAGGEGIATMTVSYILQLRNVPSLWQVGSFPMGTLGVLGSTGMQPLSALHN